MVIEAARTLGGLADAGSAEFDATTAHPVVATMSDQLDVVAGERDMGGTMRLGLYPADLADGSIVRELYGEAKVSERHRHRYEVSNAYRDRLEEAGLRFSGLSPDGGSSSTWSCPASGTRSSSARRRTRVPVRPTRPHPLFTGLIAAALDYAEQRAGDA